jgi:hypothetical protein
MHCCFRVFALSIINLYMIKGNRSFMQGLLTTHTVRSCCGLQMMYSNNHCRHKCTYCLMQPPFPQWIKQNSNSKGKGAHRINLRLNWLKLRAIAGHTSLCHYIAGEVVSAKLHIQGKTYECDLKINYVCTHKSSVKNCRNSALKIWWCISMREIYMTYFTKILNFISKFFSRQCLWWHSIWHSHMPTTKSRLT